MLFKRVQNTGDFAVGQTSQLKLSRIQASVHRSSSNEPLILAILQNHCQRELLTRRLFDKSFYFRGIAACMTDNHNNTSSIFFHKRSDGVYLQWSSWNMHQHRIFELVRSNVCYRI